MQCRSCIAISKTNFSSAQASVGKFEIENEKLPYFKKKKERKGLDIKVPNYSKCLSLNKRRNVSIEINHILLLEQKEKVIYSIFFHNKQQIIQSTFP